MHTTLEDRVETLERSNRRWRLAAFVAIAAAGFAMALGLAQPAQVPELIQAKRIEIVSDSGVPVLTLTQNGAGGIFATQSHAGEILVTVTATATGEGVIALADRTGRRLVELAGKPGEGVGVVNTFSAEGQVAASMLASKGAGVVQTFRGEHPTAMLGGVGGYGVLALFDEQGDIRETVPADAKKER